MASFVVFFILLQPIKIKSLRTNITLMKRKTLLLTIAMAVTSLTASAQYVYRDELFTLTATGATDVDDYGFYANWTPLTEDQIYDSEAKVLGFYVRTYAAKRAKVDGEKFYYINTDFSFLTSQYTIDNPHTDVTIDNSWIQGSLNEPYRPGAWKVVNAGQANGVLVLDSKLNKSVCNGALVLNYTNLTQGDGIVHFRFKVRSDGKAKTLGVHMRDISKFPNEDVDAKIIDGLTTEWQEVEFTLQKDPNDTDHSLKEADIIIYCDDTGNLSSQFVFIDDLQIWKELKAGEVGYVQYGEQFLKDDPEASQLYMSYGDVYEGEDVAYTAHCYNLEGISYDSNMVFIHEETAINAPEADDVNPATPVTVYNLNGTVVARGTVGNMPAMPKGVLIVKTGDKVKKVVVK